MNHGAGAGIAVYLRHHASCNPNVSCACPSRSPNLPEPHPQSRTTQGGMLEGAGGGGTQSPIRWRPRWVCGDELPAPVSSSCLFFAVTALWVPPHYFAPPNSSDTAFPEELGQRRAHPPATTVCSPPSAGSSPKPGHWVPLSHSCYSAPHPPVSGTQPTGHLGSRFLRNRMTASLETDAVLCLREAWLVACVFCIWLRGCG